MASLATAAEAIPCLGIRAQCYHLCTFSGTLLQDAETSTDMIIYEFITLSTVGDQFRPEDSFNQKSLSSP